MNNKDIEWRSKNLEEQRRRLESEQWNSLRQLLPNDAIRRICEECKYEFRTRLLTPLVIIFHMIGAGMSREGSFQSSWEIIGQSGQSGSLAKGRRRVSGKVWQGLDRWIVREIDKEFGELSHWRGHRIVGVDGTCLSMSDKPGLRKHFGRAGSRSGKSRFPVARATLAFDLGTMASIAHELGTYRKSEMELFRPILKHLGPGDVVVADRQFSGANLYAEYRQAGVNFITRVHGHLRVEELEILKEFSPGDGLVKMQVYPEHRRKNPKLPKSVLVRLIQTAAKLEGKRQTFWIATSLLDPEVYPAKEIQGQLKRRWKVEGLIEELKMWLGLDVLRSQSVAGIYKEFCARVIGLNLVHWLILKAAKQSKKKPERLSVAATLRLAASYSLKMSTAPAWRMRLLYEEMLQHIGQSVVPERPNRLEPRLKKREPKKYARLKISRSEWRRLIALAA